MEVLLIHSFANFDNKKKLFTRAIQKVNNVYTYILHTCFVAANHWFLVFGVILKSCHMQLYIGPCNLVSAEIAWPQPIENPANCEMRGVTSFLQVDEILYYLAEAVSSCMELFCCMTMHVCILPIGHKHCYMSNSIGTSSNILRTVQTWHCQTFSCFQK